MHRPSNAITGSKRPCSVPRRAMTLLELIIAMSILVMVVGAMGGLARTAQQAFEYSEGYGGATQHARVAMDRIIQTVSQAAANEVFPGCIVVPEIEGSEEFPDTLVVWRPTLPIDPKQKPRFRELVMYCPKTPADPKAPFEMVEMTAPLDDREVPLVDDMAGWRSRLSALKQALSTQFVELSPLLRKCTTTAGAPRGAARFEVRYKPTDAEWTDKADLRQVWVRIELQFVPAIDWIASNKEAAQPIPFFGSATMYYNLPSLVTP